MASRSSPEASEESSRPRSDILARVSELSFDYPGATAGLTGINLEIRDGEALGLLGPNGSGKSTLLRLLMNGPAPGLEVFGEAAGVRGRWLAADNPVFRPWLSGGENAEMLLELWGLGAKEARGRGAAWLQRFELTEVASRPVATYSTGMRKRLSLAVLFAADPRLALLDEPLAALDPRGREVLAEAVDGRRSAGSTVVVSTHDPEFAAARFDRVAFLLGGKCTAVDTPTRLLATVGESPRIEIRFGPNGEPDATELGSPPPGVSPRADGAKEMILEVAEPRHALPTAIAWLLDAGATIASVEVREPTLRDAFLELTGQRLDEQVA